MTQNKENRDYFPLIFMLILKTDYHAVRTENCGLKKRHKNNIQVLNVITLRISLQYSLKSRIN